MCNVNGIRKYRASSSALFGKGMVATFITSRAMITFNAEKGKFVTNFVGQICRYSICQNILLFV